MSLNQGSMAGRQRERARMQQAQEKLAKRQERREKKKVTTVRVDNPLEDPTIDWSGAVREVKITDPPEEATPADDEPARAPVQSPAQPPPPRRPAHLRASSSSASSSSLLSLLALRALLALLVPL